MADCLPGRLRWTWRRIGFSSSFLETENPFGNSGDTLMPDHGGYDPEKAVKDCVVYLERNSPPRLLFSGEDLVEVSLPAGARVVYAKPPIPGLRDPESAIRHAIDHPENMEPLRALLKPGMKITIAIDDISLPLPMMKLPDIRQSALEILLGVLAASGIEDIHIIIATSVHRRMTAGAMRRCVGARIFKAFYPVSAFLGRNEDLWSGTDRLKARAARFALSRMSAAMKRKVFFSIPAPYEMIGVYAGETEATHRKILQHCYDQYCVPIQGQSDVMITGITFVSPYNVNSIMNPLLVQVMALGYFFNFYRNMPVVKKNGVLILTHPCYDEFDPLFHPSYIEFFNRILTETRDSFVIQQKYEEEFARDRAYIKMYREGNAYHGAHPFYMWYWGENGRAHVGKVIVVGATNQRVPSILGWDTAATMEEAIEMAESHVGRKPSITLMHFPPILMAEVAGVPESIPKHDLESVGAPAS